MIKNSLIKNLTIRIIFYKINLKHIQDYSFLKKFKLIKFKLIKFNFLNAYIVKNIRALKLKKKKSFLTLKLLTTYINYNTKYKFSNKFILKKIIILKLTKLINLILFIKYFLRLKIKNNLLKNKKYTINNLKYKINYKNKFYLKYKIRFMNYYISFFKYSLEKLFKEKVFLKVINLKVHNNVNMYGFNLKKYLNYFKKNFSNININIFCYIFNLFLIHKDLNLLSDWFFKNVESLPFKNHKKFFTFFRNFFLKNERIFLNIFNIKGFFFDIRGKVGVAGNSKKRHFYFYIGKIDTSTKSTKVEQKLGIIKTHTGCLGTTFILSY